MQVKVLWSASLASESSRLEFAAMLTRPSYSSVVRTVTLLSIILTRSPESPSPLSYRAEHSALVKWLPHMSLASSSNESSVLRQTPRSCHMERQMHGVMCSPCTQTGRGSDMISGCQTDFESIDLHCDLHISIWWTWRPLLLRLRCCMGPRVFPHKGR